MMRRFIVDSIKRWVTLYGVDGFRFDLMGIHDKDTMNIIRKELDKINPLIMLYGEGWHMPSIMTEGLKSSIQNQRKVPNIGMFNDRYRDTLKGPHSNLKEKGFLCGNKSKTDLAATCYTGTTVEQNRIC
jgi:pullulanase